MNLVSRFIFNFRPTCNRLLWLLLSLLLHLGTLALFLRTGARGDALLFPIEIEVTQGKAPGAGKDLASSRRIKEKNFVLHRDLMPAIRPHPSEKVEASDESILEKTETDPEARLVDGSEGLFAPSGFKNGSVEARNGPIGVSSPEGILRHRVFQIIQRSKSYPLSARQEGRSGITLVSFSVGQPDPDVGGLAKVSVAATVQQTSGHSDLDRAALQAVFSLRDRLIWPTGLGQKLYGFMVPIEFSLRL